MTHTVRVAGGQGFWGDWLEAPRRQVEGGPIDYLVLDYLAEVTMSVLQKQKERDSALGYARDIVPTLEQILPTVVEKDVRVVANAGGVNPRSCALAVRAVADKLRLGRDVQVGVVVGDDLMPRLDELIAAGHPFAHMETGAPLTTIRDQVLAANAYLGSGPIVDALGRGATIVITGRTTDTALTIGPLRHAFGWPADAYDTLAGALVAGHIIECGAQASGGNSLYDWRNIPDLADVGYPIVECVGDGSCVVTKHPGTGGRVSVPDVTEQLVYEIGDPRSYFSPDVIADFTTIQLAQAGPDRVQVSGATGRAPTEQLKVSIAYRAGYKAIGTLTYAWPDAYEKAQAADRIIRERVDRLGLQFDRVLTEFVGANATHGALAPPPSPDLAEVQLRIGVRGQREADVERFTREIAPLVLNGPPSATGYGGARPRPQEIVAFWPALVDARVVRPVVNIM